MTNPPITWHTEQRRLGSLREWDKNPRQLSAHDAKHIKQSLDTFGLADPLIINADGQLIGGHQRKRILADPDALVDVRVPSRQLSEREAEELAVRLNKNVGGWDFDTLANNFEVDSLLDWGFKEFELGITPEVDYEKEWEGMPEFEQEDKNAFRTIIVHFDTQEAVDEFSQLVKQKFTDKTKWIWYPKKEYEPYGVIDVKP